jgi:hypothetical protein
MEKPNKSLACPFGATIFVSLVVTKEAVGGTNAGASSGTISRGASLLLQLMPKRINASAGR